MATATSCITLTALRRMHPGDLMWDTDLSGFGARCQAKCISYILKTRIRGRQRWITIGRHGAPWTPETKGPVVADRTSDILLIISDATHSPLTYDRRIPIWR